MNHETNTIIAQRYLGLATHEDYVDWAVACLESNVDSKNIRILASLRKHLYPSEIEDYFNRCLKDLGWSMPERRECLLDYACTVAQLILSREVSPLDGCAKIYRVVVALQYPRELMPWIYLDEDLHPATYRDLQGADLDEAIMSEARRLVKDSRRFDLDNSVL